MFEREEKKMMKGRIDGGIKKIRVGKNSTKQEFIFWRKKRREEKRREEKEKFAKWKRTHK